MNNDLSTIETRISTLLTRYLGPHWSLNPELRVDITGCTGLQSDLTLDSFQVMEFLMEIEDEFDLAINMSQLSDVRTVSDLAAVVARHLD